MMQNLLQQLQVKAQVEVREDSTSSDSFLVLALVSLDHSLSG